MTFLEPLSLGRGGIRETGKPATVLTSFALGLKVAVDDCRLRQLGHQLAGHLAFPFDYFP